MSPRLPTAPVEAPPLALVAEELLAALDAGTLPPALAAFLQAQPAIADSLDHLRCDRMWTELRAAGLGVYAAEETNRRLAEPQASGRAAREVVRLGQTSG